MANLGLAMSWLLSCNGLITPLTLALAMAASYIEIASLAADACLRPDANHDASMLKIAPIYTASAILLALAAAPARAADNNDYPTEARADYVYVCMKMNGETQEMLKRCSCSIDVIASLLPYDHYEAAQTVASMNQALGQIGTMFRNSPQAKETSVELRRAQAEAEVRCF